MVTQCDIGTTVHIGYPHTGGVVLHITRDGIVILALASHSMSNLMKELWEKYMNTDRIDCFTFDVAYKLIMGYIDVEKS